MKCQIVTKLDLIVVCLVGLHLSGCATSRSASAEKIVIDSANGGSDTPDWVRSTKASWVSEDGRRLYKAFYSAKGEERVSACYSIARLNIQEAIAAEIFSEFKAVTSHATQGTLEDAADILQQTRNSETGGTIQGVRLLEEFHQRYLVNGTERIDCFVLADLSEADHRKVRSQFLNSIAKSAPVLKRAIEERHLMVFKKAEPELKQEEPPSIELSEESTPLSEAQGPPILPLSILPKSVAGSELPKEPIRRSPEAVHSNSIGESGPSPSAYGLATGVTKYPPAD